MPPRADDDVVKVASKAHCVVTLEVVVEVVVVEGLVVVVVEATVVFTGQLVALHTQPGEHVLGLFGPLEVPAKQRTEVEHQPHSLRAVHDEHAVCWLHRDVVVVVEAVVVEVEVVVVRGTVVVVDVVVAVPVVVVVVAAVDVGQLEETHAQPAEHVPGLLGPVEIPAKQRDVAEHQPQPS
jgi:hypothetical protein